MQASLSSVEVLPKTSAEANHVAFRAGYEPEILSGSASDGDNYLTISPTLDGCVSHVFPSSHTPPCTFATSFLGQTLH